MKLSIKKSFNLGKALFRLSLGDKFTVKDENDNDRFTAKGISLKSEIYDTTGKLVAAIRRPDGMMKAHKYNIEVDGKVVCEITRKAKVIGMGVEINGLPWVVEYDNVTAEHKVKHHDEVIMTINDKVAFLGESYDIEIFDAENELICVAIVLAIDNIKR